MRRVFLLVIMMIIISETCSATWSPELQRKFNEEIEKMGGHKCFSKNEYHVSLHGENCKGLQGWQFIDCSDNCGYFYNTSNIEKKNKFNPFVDGVVEIWIAKHFLDESTLKDLFQVNIDKKTYKILTKDSSKDFHIAPDTIYEKIYVVAKEKYDE